MLEKANYQIVHSGTGSYGRSLAEILRVLFRKQGVVPDVMEEYLRSSTFEIDLGDLFVLARKVE
jgi:hypothetical protein